MTQNMNTNDDRKKTDPSSWTAYGDPLKNNSTATVNEEHKKATSPIIEKAQQDGNIVKKV